MQVHRPGQASYAGRLTYCSTPLVLDPAELPAGGVAVLGAPVDEGVSTRPGARYGPRAIRLADDGGGVPPERPHLDLGVDPFAVLTVVDHGDVEVVAGDPAGNLERVERAVAAVFAAGAAPVVLGGDHSIAVATVGAASASVGVERLAVVQVDAHADTGEPGPGRPRWTHGAPFRVLIDEGRLRGERLVQLGLRGAWPGPPELEWARAAGVRWRTMRTLRRDGLDAAIDETVAALAGAPVWLSLDIDAADPAFAPGTGTPEPGGLASHEYLHLVGRLAAELDVCGLELVEVAPAYDHAELTAMLAHRLVLEALSGMALRR